MKKLFLLLILTSFLPSAARGQIELKNLSFRKTHDLTWDVSWKIDVINRGNRAVRIWLDFKFIDKDGFAVATDNGQLQVAAGDSVTYREVRAFTPAKYEAIAKMEASAEVRRPLFSPLRRPLFPDQPPRRTHAISGNVSEHHLGETGINMNPIVVPIKSSSRDPYEVTVSLRETDCWKSLNHRQLTASGEYQY